MGLQAYKWDTRPVNSAELSTPVYKFKELMSDHSFLTKLSAFFHYFQVVCSIKIAQFFKMLHYG